MKEHRLCHAICNLLAILAKLDGNYEHAICRHKSFVPNHVFDHVDREGEGATALMALSSTGVPSSISSDVTFSEEAKTLSAAAITRARMSANDVSVPASIAGAGGETAGESAIDVLLVDAGQQTGTMTGPGRPEAEAEMPEAASDAFYSRIRRPGRVCGMR